MPYFLQEPNAGLGVGVPGNDQESEKVDWHDYKAIENEKQRQGNRTHSSNNGTGTVVVMLIDISFVLVYFL